MHLLLPHKTLGEKAAGLKEELEGKILRNESKVQHGRDVRTGEQMRREREADVSLPSSASF